MIGEFFLTRLERAALDALGHPHTVRNADPSHIAGTARDKIGAAVVGQMELLWSSTM